MSARTSPNGLGRPVSSGLRRRRLDRYPPARQRYRYLAITVLSTVVLYYELYVQGAVATTIIATFGITFAGYVTIAVVGNLLGAFASLATGVVDRWGRANLVVAGLFVTGLLVCFGLPMAPDIGVYAGLFVVLSVVEGMVLVATPALIRDFSPQLGRASAMGFWTLGPVLGSLLVTMVSSNTLAAHPNWQFQFRVCGATGLVVAVIALVGLRELSPALRGQVMVSLRDRAVVEARAARADPDRALQGQWRRMLTLDVLGSAVAISTYLIFYYIAVGFFVVYFATAHHYSEARANSLANWYWVSTAVALVATGFLSDRLRVRKPFMLGGALLSATALAVFTAVTTRPEVGYYHYAAVLVAIGVGNGLAYCAWMAGFTETVERHNPAATATGLAIWGWINRIVVALALAGVILMLPAVSAPSDRAVAGDIPAQWQRWWLVCLAGQLVFIPLVFIVPGRWSPARARSDAARHRAHLDRELSAVRAATATTDNNI